MLSYSELFEALLLSVMLIVAGYQFYFLPQRRPIKEPAVGRVTTLDRKIPFRPEWVWVYSVAYYPYVLSTILTLPSFQDFYAVSASFICLLFTHILISYFYPVRTPAEWRAYQITSPSRRFLRSIQCIDRGGNCFPSMHVAVATLTTIHITANGYEAVGPEILLVWIAPALITASALYTKQHLLVDIIPGAILAAVAYSIYSYGLAFLTVETLRAFLMVFTLLGFLLLIWSMLGSGDRLAQLEIRN